MRIPCFIWTDDHVHLSTRGLPVEFHNVSFYNGFKFECYLHARVQRGSLNNLDICCIANVNFRTVLDVDGRNETVPRPLHRRQSWNRRRRRSGRYRHHVFRLLPLP